MDSKPIYDRVYLESLGCSKNTVDSEILLSLLQKNGFERVSSPEEASTIIVNTCAFIDEAKQEAIDTILELARYKKKGGRLIVAGCFAQLHHRAILDEMPEVDAVVGIGDLGSILEAVSAEIKRKDYPESRYIGDRFREYGEGRELLTPPGYAYLKISEGCSRKCSFCLIPSIRGKLRSREPQTIIREAKELEGRGAREIVLISQDTLSYGRDLDPPSSLGDIVTRLIAETGVRFFRLLYLRPGNELLRSLDVFNNDRVIHYFDIPLQHVSREVLGNMRRSGDTRSAFRVVNAIRSRFGDAVLRTTFIVGFPGESEEDFNLLVDFIKEARFDHLGVYSYSPQEGTAAHKLEGRVEEGTSAKRRRTLLAVQREISRTRLEANIGKVFEVIVEERVAGKNLYFGRSYHFAPEVDGVFLVESPLRLKPGDLVKAVVTRADDYDLHGRVTSAKPY